MRLITGRSGIEIFKLRWRPSRQIADSLGRFADRSGEVRLHKGIRSGLVFTDLACLVLRASGQKGTLLET